MTGTSDDTHELIADQHICDRTGKAWSEWCAIIDLWRGDKTSLATIAQYLTDHYHVRRLWAQTIAVYYRTRRIDRNETAQV